VLFANLMAGEQAVGLRSSYPSLRVFDNPALEWFTHVHPLTPLVLWGPGILWLIWRSFAVHGLSAAAVFAFAVAGLMTWSLTEYLLHRHLFHMRPRGPVRARLQFMIHGLHHDDPLDPTRLVLPPVATAVGAVVFYTALRWLLGPVWGEAVFAFFGVGYLLYDYIHYASHRCSPRTRIGRALKRNHMRHHWATPDAQWGVSSPLWDYVFGTTGDATPRVPASRSLH
jgi:sterol desaturase/sphingolipid hydroxylase (fatty acid hydroxylase superfamily)